jgi:hypothetical protein
MYKVATKPAGEYTFFCGKGNENYKLGTEFFVHKGVTSAVIEGRVCYL